MHLSYPPAIHNNLKPAAGLQAGSCRWEERYALQSLDGTGGPHAAFLWFAGMGCSWVQFLRVGGFKYGSMAFIFQPYLQYMYIE